MKLSILYSLVLILFALFDEVIVLAKKIISTYLHGNNTKY